MAGSWPPVLGGSQVVLFLAQYRRGERSNLFTPESLSLQSPKHRCPVLEAFATCHTQTRWQRFSPALGWTTDKDWRVCCFHLLQLKVNVTYQPKIQLPRFALQKNADYWSVEKSECPRGSSVYVPFLLFQEPPQSHSLWVSSPLTPFPFCRENKPII